MSISEINNEIEDLEGKLAEVRTLIQKRVETKRRDILNSYSGEIKKLEMKLSSARKRQRELIESTATHEWEGQRVYRIVKLYGKFNLKPNCTRLEGVVEIMRMDTVLPGNISKYSRPSLGEAFVRLCKANGEVGLKVDRIRPDPYRAQDGGWWVDAG